MRFTFIKNAFEVFEGFPKNKAIGIESEDGTIVTSKKGFIEDKQKRLVSKISGEINHTDEHGEHTQSHKEILVSTKEEAEIHAFELSKRFENVTIENLKLFHKEK